MIDYYAAIATLFFLITTSLTPQRDPGRKYFWPTVLVAQISERAFFVRKKSAFGEQSDDHWSGSMHSRISQ